MFTSGSVCCCKPDIADCVARDAVSAERKLQKTSVAAGFPVPPTVGGPWMSVEEEGAVTCVEAEAGNSDWLVTAVRVSNLVLGEPGEGACVVSMDDGGDLGGERSVLSAVMMRGDLRPVLKSEVDPSTARRLEASLVGRAHRETVPFVFSFVQKMAAALSSFC